MILVLTQQHNGLIINASFGAITGLVGGSNRDKVNELIDLQSIIKFNDYLDAFSSMVTGSAGRNGVLRELNRGIIRRVI